MPRWSVARLLLALALLCLVCACSYRHGGSRPASKDIFEAAQHGDATAVGWFLFWNSSAATSRNAFGQTPLHLAANRAVAQALLDAKADIEARDSHGHTPLMWALESSHYDVVQLLIARGADVNAKDENGRAPRWRPPRCGATPTSSACYWRTARTSTRRTTTA